MKKTAFYVTICTKITIIVYFMLLQMMKHVQLSPYRSRADTVSLSSNASFSSLSPEPLGSRSSSYSSLSDASPHVSRASFFLYYTLRHYKMHLSSKNCLRITSWLLYYSKEPWQSIYWFRLYEKITVKRIRYNITGAPRYIRVEYFELTRKSDCLFLNMAVFMAW